MYDTYSNLVTSVHLFGAEILSGTEEGLGDLGEGGRGEEGRGKERGKRYTYKKEKERLRERESE